MYQIEKPFQNFASNPSHNMQHNTKRIFLIGYMGSGKSTLGKAMSRELGLDFIDLDYYIEGRYHKTVREIFAEGGEARFREIERNMLHEVADIENVIIATGGGTPCFYDNIEYMNSKGTCIYLQATVEELCRRLKTCRENRPLLRDKNDDELRDFIEKNLSSREQFYTQASHLFDTGALLSRKEIEIATKRLKDFIEKNIS